MNLRVAFRSVLRNRWRSGLTAGGIAVAVALTIWMVHMMDGMLVEMVNAITGSEIGDVQLSSQAYVEETNLFNAVDLESLRLDAVRALPEVRAASARIQAYGLLGDERHSQVARIMGVVPSAERAVSRVPDRLVSGQWLRDESRPWPASGEVVLGKILAKQLNVGVGDTLAVFTTGANGSLGNDKLVVLGIAATGSSVLDRMGAWMHLSRVQELTALEGRVHEVCVKAARGYDVDAVAAAVRGVVGDEVTGDGVTGDGVMGDGVAVRTWKEVIPSLSAMIQVSKGSMWIIYLIVFLVAALGVLNAQRMTALERRREFGVLLAIGTTPRRLAGQVLAESVILTSMGAAVGALLGAGMSWYNQVHGFDFAALSGQPGQELNYMGVVLTRFYFHLDFWSVLGPAIGMALVGVLCGVWPALSSARLDAPRAIAGRI